MSKRLKKNKDSLNNIYNIENINMILDEEEIKVINKLFNELEDFFQITDNIENALTDNRINYNQINTLFDTIKKVAYYKTSLKTHKAPKKNLVRTLFELPEIISKKIHIYMYRIK